MVWFDALDQLSPSPLRGDRESPAGGSRIAEMRWGLATAWRNRPGTSDRGGGFFKI